LEKIHAKVQRRKERIKEGKAKSNLLSFNEKYYKLWVKFFVTLLCILCASAALREHSLT